MIEADRYLYCYCDYEIFTCSSPISANLLHQISSNYRLMLLSEMSHFLHKEQCTVDVAYIMSKIASIPIVLFLLYGMQEKLDYVVLFRSSIVTRIECH